MTLNNGFKGLGVLETLGVLGSIASLVGLAIVFFPQANDKTPEQSQNAGSGSTQIQNHGGIINLTNPPNTQSEVNYQTSASGYYAVANARRSLVEARLSGPPPQKWIEAELAFKKGRDLFLHENYKEASSELKKAGELYNQLYIFLDSK